MIKLREGATDLDKEIVPIFHMDMVIGCISPNSAPVLGIHRE